MVQAGLVPGDLVAARFGQDPPSFDFIGGIAGDHIKALPLGQGGTVGEVGQHRHHLSFQVVFPDGNGELVDGLGLDVHPIALAGTGLLSAVPGQGHDPAAGTQVAGTVLAPGRGKIESKNASVPNLCSGDTQSLIRSPRASK